MDYIFVIWICLLVLYLDYLDLYCANICIVSKFDVLNLIIMNFSLLLCYDFLVQVPRMFDFNVKFLSLFFENQIRSQRHFRTDGINSSHHYHTRIL